jgi:hypothetical protein
MKVIFASTWLAPGGIYGTNGAQWNGTQVNDETEFFRAAAASFFPRGNRTTTFSFSVIETLDSEGEAMLFAATRMNELPEQADLQVVSDDGVYAVILRNAVLTSFQPGRVIGCSVEVSYSFAGGVFAVQAEPPVPPTYNVQTGKIALNAADESRVVTFPLQFSGTPTSVECWIVPATASSIKFIQAAVLSDTINNAGFTAVFGFPIPEAGYFLFWEASLPS